MVLGRHPILPEIRGSSFEQSLAGSDIHKLHRSMGGKGRHHLVESQSFHVGTLAQAVTKASPISASNSLSPCVTYPNIVAAATEATDVEAPLV